MEESKIKKERKKTKVERKRRKRSLVLETESV